MSLKIYLILFYLLIFQLNCSLTNFNLQNLKAVNDTIFDRVILSLINIIMNSAKNIEDLPGISMECRGMLDRTFFILNKDDYDEEEKNLAYYYYTKLLLDSSTNVNDLSSYTNCMERDHLYDFTNSTRKPLESLFVTLFVDHRNDILKYFMNNEKITSYLVGICFVKSCNDNDHRILAEHIMSLIKILKHNETVEIYSLNENKYQPPPLPC